MWSDAARQAAEEARQSKGAHAQAIDKLPARMTKAHFEVIAQQLRSAAPGAGASPEEHAAHSAAISQMADRLANSNPRFDRQRFIEAVSKGTVRMGARASSKSNAQAKIARMNTRRVGTF